MTDSDEYDSISGGEPTARQHDVTVPYKVKGELTNDDTGVGVIGLNTTQSGTTKGVEGRVSSSAGYGLYTPDDAKVVGQMETGTVVFVDSGGDGNSFSLTETADDNLTLSNGSTPTHEFASDGALNVSGELTEGQSL